MTTFFRRKTEGTDFKMINCYRPYQSRRKARKFRSVDVLYLLICGLIVSGIFQRIEINKLKSTMAKASNKVIVLGSNIKVSSTPTPVVKIIEKEKADVRVDRLQAFLKAKGSPLAHLAGLIVQESDKHGIDYTLIVSISGMESSFGKNAKLSCHNPFGLGGTKPLCFESWEKAIEYEAALLDSSYRINMANGIQSKYCPAYECNPAWSETIVQFANEIMKGGQAK